MTASIKRGEEALEGWLGLEYLRLLSIPTLLWITLSALLVAISDWQTGEARTPPGGLFLAAIAAALGFLLLKSDRISQLVALAGSLVLCLASVSLIWLDLIETPFLILLNYVMIFVGATAVIFTMLPSIDSSREHEPSEAPAVSPPRRKPFSFGWIGLIVGAGLAIYMIVVPALSLLISRLSPQPTSRQLTDMTMLESLRLHAVSGVVMCLFLATGASIGSFLNVVIYRLPRKMRLLWPPSTCPNCGYKIHGWDNLPILAWVGLRGKCRQCQVAISARYPVIEIIGATFFVLLLYVELLSGGGNLPVREPNLYNGIVWILLYTKWDLVSIYCLHTAMLSVLLAWGMINYDLFRVPKVAALAVVVFSAICISFFPFLNPTSKIFPSLQIPASVAACLMGLLAGAVCGFVLQFFFKHPRLVTNVDSAEVLQQIEPQVASPIESSVDLQNQPLVDLQNQPLVDLQNQPAEPITAQEVQDASQSPPAFKPQEVYGTAASSPQHTPDAVFCLLLVGSIMGPSAVLSIGAVTALLGGLLQLIRKVGIALPTIPITLLIFLVTTSQVALWRQTSLIPLAWWPKPESSLTVIAAWIALFALISAGADIARRLSSKPESA